VADHDGLVQQQFALRKKKGEKRVFILGESTANWFPAEVLAQGLRSVSPGFDWRVINCGLGGYDSYRVSLVAREISRYEPDLVILMMANNEGHLNPVTINRWVYASPLLAKSWIFRAVTDLIDPPLTVTGDQINGHFEKNLNAIIALFARNGVPTVLCTLPNNHAIPLIAKIQFHNPAQFDPWYLLGRKPGRSLELFEKISRDTGDGRDFRWYTARANEALGRGDAAQELSRIDGDKPQAQRNGILRAAAARNRGTVVLADFDALLKRRSDGVPGFEYFWDGVHFWPPVYALLSGEILRSIKMSPPASAGLGAPAGWSRSAIDRLGEGVVAQDRAIVKNIETCVPCLYAGFFYRNDVMEHLIQLVEILKYYYDVNPGLFRQSNIAKIKAMKVQGTDGRDDCTIRLCAMGEALREKGQFSAAVGFLDEAMRGEKSATVCRLFRGLCYYDLQEVRRADADFAILGRNDPRFRWLTAAYLDRLLREG
jgi:hypothetical protein